MTPEELEVAKIKATIYNAVISNGSSAQKEKAIETSKQAFDWCMDHVVKAKVAPTGTGAKIK